MVKNTKGGSRNKKLARKNVNEENVKQKTRLANPDEPSETYANVTKLYGGNNCEVLCNDGVTRLCVIRKKFRGRNKRGNIIEVNTKVLVGLRDWEIIAEGKKQKCDLLEVYTREQHNDLRKDKNVNWNVIRTTGDGLVEKESEEAFEFAFGDDDMDDIDVDEI